MVARSRTRGCLVRGLPITLPIIFAVAGCNSTPPPPSDVARPVKTMVVVAGEETHMRSFPGKADASRKVELAFQVSGLLVKLPVKCPGHDPAANRPVLRGDGREPHVRLGVLRPLVLDRHADDVRDLLPDTRDSRGGLKPPSTITTRFGV